MANPIPAGAASVLIPFQHQLVSRSAAIVFGVDVSGAVAADPTTANLVFGAFNTTLGQLVDSQVTMGPAKMRFGVSGGAAISVDGTTTAGGQSALSSLPGNCAVLIKKATALGGRHGRGRMFLPWMVSESLTDEAGRIDSSQVTAIQTAAAAFLAALASSSPGTPMVLLHQSGVATATPVTSLSTDSLIGSQRRRLGR